MRAYFVEEVAVIFGGWPPRGVGRGHIFPPVVLGGFLVCRFAGSDHIAILVSAILGLSFASFRRFWAIAASVDSSLTPQGPRSRSRPSPRMRLR